MSGLKRNLSAIFLLALTGIAHAHDLRPGYLQIVEKPGSEYEIDWRIPARGGLRLAIDPQLPPNCVAQSAPAIAVSAEAMSAHITVRCVGGIVGRTVSVAGLSTTLTDVLARFQGLDNHSQTVLLRPAEPAFVIATLPSLPSVALTYTRMGIEHIMTGFDHLLFVIAMLLVVKGWRRRVIMLSAFTLAHSVTLAAATLGFIHAPPALAEAAIALSIVCVAAEVANRNGASLTLTARWPSLIAFLFGLLHGAGFAGALAEMGLPQHAIPLALLCFNVGIELGQLLVLGAVFAATCLWHRYSMPWNNALRSCAGYAIGTIAAFWVFERVADFF